MNLSKTQIAEFHEQGYVFLPDVFSGDEIAVLSSELDGIFSQDRPENVREKNGKAVRTTFAAHTFNEAFKRLGRHPRLIEPVMQILDGSVYIHQFKINAKAAFDGDVWQWHQDYGTWARDDLMPEPRAMNIALFIDEVSEFNGPLMFIPGSHKGELFNQYNDEEQWMGCLSPADAATLDESSAVYIEAPAGSITVHNCRTVHGSPASDRDDGRPLLLNAYASADAFPYTPHPQPSRHAGEVVRGGPARWAHHDPRPCQIPPDWSGGYTSIFAAQAGEEGSGERAAAES